MLEGEIKIGQSESGNIGYTRQDKQKKPKTQHNMCWRSLYANKHK